MSWHSRRSSYWDQYDFIDQNPICRKRALPQNNKEDNECKLKEILNETWFNALSSTIKSNYDSKEFLGPEQYRSENILPRRSLIFGSLNISKYGKTLHPRDWRVIIIGDHPSSKAGNCCSGLPFYDNISIKTWMDHSNKSIKYIFFNLLQFYGYISNEISNYDEMEDLLNKFEDKYGKEMDIPSPSKWINYTMNEGVMWINQCLTIDGIKEKDQHYRFWKPIIRSIFYTILCSKKNLKRRDGRKGTLFVVFDKKTKNFIRSIQSQIPSNKRTQIKIIKMDYNLYMDFKKYFVDIKLMQKINDSLDVMGMEKIKWFNDDLVQKLNKIIIIKQRKDEIESKDNIEMIEKKEDDKNNDNNNHNKRNFSDDDEEDIDLDIFKNHNKKKTNTVKKNKNDQYIYDDGIDSDDFSC